MVFNKAAWNMLLTNNFPKYYRIVTSLCSCYAVDLNVQTYK